MEVKTWQTVVSGTACNSAIITTTTTIAHPSTTSTSSTSRSGGGQCLSTAEDPDLNQLGSCSPFVSSSSLEEVWDPSIDHNDRDPLLMPPRQGIIHQLLSFTSKPLGKKPRIQNVGGNDNRIPARGKEDQFPPRHSKAETPMSPFQEPSSMVAEEPSPVVSQSLSLEEDRVGVGVILPHNSEDEEDEEVRVIKVEERRGKCSMGILLASVSCIFFATSALIVKVSSLHPMELLCVRGLIQALLTLPIVFLSRNNVMGMPGTRGLLFARATLGSISLMLSFASIKLIGLGDAATVIFTAPVFVSIFACAFLGEACGGFEITMILLTLIGVVLVSQPSFSFINNGSFNSILGTACGLGAAVTMAAALTVLRRLKNVHYSVTVFWFSSVLAVLGATMTIALDGFKFPTEWPQILDCLGIGLCGFLGQTLLTKALQVEAAGPCAVARTLDIVLAFFYQITLLHDTPDWYSYLGSFFVVSSVLLTGFRRWYVDKYCVQMAQFVPNNNANNGANRYDKIARTGRNGAPCCIGTNATTTSSRNCNYGRANTNIA